MMRPDGSREPNRLITRPDSFSRITRVPSTITARASHAAPNASTVSQNIVINVIASPPGERPFAVADEQQCIGSAGPEGRKMRHFSKVGVEIRHCIDDKAMIE
jgi:hypothetical protein